MIDENPAIERLLAALARAELADGFPGKLLFIWIEPKEAQGYGLSGPVRAAVAMAVKRIRKELMTAEAPEMKHSQEEVIVSLREA